ncbi:hypothetical protein BGX26_004860, partial [Mortierella sp. AD094]
ATLRSRLLKPHSTELLETSSLRSPPKLELAPPPTTIDRANMRLSVEEVIFALDGNVQGKSDGHDLHYSVYNVKDERSSISPINKLIEQVPEMQVNLVETRRPPPSTAYSRSDNSPSNRNRSDATTQDPLERSSTPLDTNQLSSVRESTTETVSATPTRTTSTTGYHGGDCADYYYDDEFTPWKSTPSPALSITNEHRLPTPNRRRRNLIVTDEHEEIPTICNTFASKAGQDGWMSTDPIISTPVPVGNMPPLPDHLLPPPSLCTIARPPPSLTKTLATILPLLLPPPPPIITSAILELKYENRPRSHPLANGPKELQADELLKNSCVN